MPQLKFIDLFCGIGGFHQAMNELNCKCVFACDIDEDCRKTYEKNYNLKPEGDINNVVIENIPPFDILCGGFPCQPFSQAGKQKGFNDNRGDVFYKICSIIEFHNPKYILLENVKTLKSHNKGQTWQTIKTKIRELNYDIYDEPLIINTLLYNIPQHRDRAFILGINKSEGNLPALPTIPKLIKKNVKCSIDDIIIDDDIYNKKYKISTKIKNIKNIWNNFINILNDNNIIIPKFPLWSDWWDSDGKNTNLYKINKNKTDNENQKIILDKVSKFKIKYKNLIEKNRKFYNDNKLLLKYWLDESRKNKYWIGSVRKLEWQVCFNPKSNLDSNLFTFRSSGVRVKDKNYTPALVAMTHIPIIGNLDRQLSPKECLRLQNFPDDFIIGDDKKIYKQLGNAVNCYVIEKLLRFLILNETLF